MNNGLPEMVLGCVMRKGHIASFWDDSDVVIKMLYALGETLMGILQAEK